MKKKIRYGNKLFNLNCEEGKMKETLREFLQAHTEKKAFLLGSRSTDPFCGKFIFVIFGNEFLI